MGRQKISIKRIKDERIRQVTYYKRKRGLLKKAMELSLLCGIDVFLSIVDKNNKVMIYCSADKIKQFVTKHFSTPEKAREIFLNRDYEDIFIKRTHLCEFKHMKKKISSERDHNTDSISDISDEIDYLSEEEKVDENKGKENLINNTFKREKLNKANKKIFNLVSKSIERLSEKDYNENKLIHKNGRTKQSPNLNKIKEEKTNKANKKYCNNIRIKNNKKTFENNIGKENKNKNSLTNITSNQYKIAVEMPSNENNITETMYSKKNSAESNFRKFIIENKIGFNQSTISDNYPVLNFSNITNNNPFSEKIYEIEQNNDSKNKFKLEENQVQCEMKKEFNNENVKDNSHHQKKIETQGISKLKNKLSLKVKIPEEKSEKNNRDNSNSNNNNNNSVDFENNIYSNLNLNNDELTVINFNPDNFSSMSQEGKNKSINDAHHSKFKINSSMNSPYKDGAISKTKKINLNVPKIIEKINNNEAPIYKNNDYISNFNPNFMNNNNYNNFNINNDNGLFSVPQNNEFAFGSQNYIQLNNDISNNHNNYLMCNDPLFSGRKRLREDYSTFSPLYSANLKAYTPLLSVNSPGMSGFFIFNNGGQSMTATPLPFKIQNNVMLTSFFQPQNATQNLTLNLNNICSLENGKISNLNNNLMTGTSSNCNFNNNNESSKDREIGKDPRFVENTIQESSNSNSLDKTIKNNKNKIIRNKINKEQFTLQKHKYSNQDKILFNESQNNNTLNLGQFHKNLNANMQNIANLNEMSINVNSNSQYNNSSYEKINSHKLVFVPSPLPMNNSFYGWIFNNANAHANVNSSIDLNLKENPKNEFTNNNKAKFSTIKDKILIKADNNRTRNNIEKNLTSPNVNFKIIKKEVNSKTNK